MDFGMSVLRNREMERKRLKYASAMIPKQMVIQAQVFRGSYIQKVTALQIFMSQWTTVMVSDTVASDISIFPCKGKYNKN